MWTGFKCTKCNEEWADSDVGLEEIPTEAAVDEHGNFITECEDCAEKPMDRREWEALIREAKALGYSPTQVRAILAALKSNGSK